MAPSPPWSDLPPEILSQIFEKIADDFGDLLSCSSVCVSWCSAMELLFHNLKPTSPLLLLKHQGFDRNPKSSSLSPPLNQAQYCLFDIESAEFHVLRLPELRGRWFSSCSYGWLLTVGCEWPHEVHLLNPITRARIRLPSTGKEAKEQKGLRVVASTSLSNPDCVILAVHPYDNDLGICRIGDRTWRRIRYNVRRGYAGECRREGCVDDAIFYKDEFYVVGADDFMYSVNPNRSPSPVMKKLIRTPRSTNQHRIKYLVELEGDLLLVTRYGNVKDCSKILKDGTTCKYKTYRTRWFKVHKLDMKGKRRKWVAVDSLGNNAIYLGRLSSTSLAVEHSPSKKARPNLIYFIDDANHENYRDTGFTHMKVTLPYRHSSRHELIWHTQLDWYKPYAHKM